MQDIDLIQDFAILLLAAGIAGLLCKRVGLSAIVGYLVAGIIIGPHTPPFSLIIDEGRINALSQVGLVFLMFNIGLGLSLSKFARLGAGTLVATALGAGVILTLTEVLGGFVGWTPLQSMFIAAMLMVSSSAVIAKVVAEQKLSHERSSQTALAVTVLEDVVAVAMLTILASQAQSAKSEGEGLGSLLGGLGAFVALLVGAGLLLVPRLMRRLETRADPEMQTVIVAGVLFALALGAAKAGYSIALGAFIFGAIVAEIPQKVGVEASFRGLRDLFSSVFFVSIGMLIDVKLLTEVWPMILALTGFALVARPVACGLALVLVGTEPREARRASLLLTPLGEFSFIIAQLGISTAILSPAFYPIAVGASILTIFAAPLMNRRRDALLGFVDRFEPRWISRTLDAYHAWFVDLRDRPARTPLWGLLRPRLGQIALEMLFVSGVLIFSETLLEAAAGTELGRRFESATLSYVFWSAVAVIVLVPLVAIWRNSSALALLMAEAWEISRLPRLVIERVLKAIALLILASWLYLVLPRLPFSQGGWLVVAAGVAVIVATFSRRLVFWHSQWQSSMQEVLADNRADVGELRAQARATLGESLGGWKVALAEATLPEGSSLAGQSLAQLGLPSRFGCSVIEVGRNGHVVSAPGGDFALYPGDSVLLVGEPARLEAARVFLEAHLATVPKDSDFAGILLDTCRVAGPRVGSTLAELQLAPRTGVRVVGIQRGRERIFNPQGGERLQAGDDLLVLGTMAKIRRFRQWLLQPQAASALDR